MAGAAPGCRPPARNAETASAIATHRDVVQPNSSTGGQVVTLRGGLLLGTALARRLVKVDTLLYCVADLPAEAVHDGPAWIRSATAADTQALARLSGGRRTVRKRLAGGDYAVVAEQEDQLIGVVWITARPLRLPGYGLNVDASPEVPYSYGLRVVPSARRRGVGTALAYYVREVEGPRLGFRCMSYHISPSNPMTYRRHVAEANALTIGELRVLVLLDRIPRVIRSRRMRSPPTTRP